MEISSDILFMRFSVFEVELVMVPNFCCHVDLQSSHGYVYLTHFAEVVLGLLNMLVPFFCIR